MRPFHSLLMLGICLTTPFLIFFSRAIKATPGEDVALIFSGFAIIIVQAVTIINTWKKSP